MPFFPYNMGERRDIVKVDNYTLSPGSFCFVRRIKEHLLKKGGKQLSDGEMIELLKECFKAVSCLQWYQSQFMIGTNELSDEALLAHLCELRCTEDDILEMIAEGYMFSKAEGRMSSNDEGRMSSDILQKIDFELQYYRGEEGFQKRKRRNEKVWYFVD